MFGEKDLSSSSGHGFEGFKSKLVKQSDLGQDLDNPDEKIGFSDKGLELPGESKPSKRGNLSSQELSLSYLCESGKMGFRPEKNLANLKGKEVVLETSCDDERWVVRDFLQLSDKSGGSSKREIEDEGERERNSRDKKAKMETLNLSLALPDVSLTLNTSNPAQNADPQPRIPLNPSRSVQSLATSNNMTQTTCSDDFTAASLSYSYSNPFSHNPSCSLTRNSTENYEYSAGSHNKIWHCGEGTNGSVHSRFRPVGDGVELAGHGGSVGHSLMHGSRSFNKDMSNSLYKAACSNSNSFFPSELPARARIETLAADSRGRASDLCRVLDALDHRTNPKLFRIVLQCVSESIMVMSQIFQELPAETVESVKDYLRNLIAAPEGKNELVSLQNQLERRSDLTKETLSKSHRLQLEILVAVKFGLGEFLSQKIHVPTAELVEIFMLLRCRNFNCKSMLPVDDCECNICSTKKGYCSHCMCPVCSKFDSASNTCSWVGCDVCSHWCHASCGIEKKFIRAGSSSKGPLGTSGMHFHCPGCGHASEMLGFVKDVFECCAKDWSVDTLMKELDCVRKIFKGSDDVKGKALYLKAQETIYRLERRVTSSYDACNLILHFFNSAGGGKSDSLAPNIAQKDATTSQAVLTKETIPHTSSNHLSLSTTSSLLREMLPRGDLHVRDLTSGKLSKNNDGFESLESVVRIKEAEARMFQIRAEEARKEAERYHQLARVRAEKLDEEYAEKLAKLCLQETEERRRKKLEELKLLESSHCDYYNMKVRMQADIAGLLERMESTKQQLV